MQNNAKQLDIKYVDNNINMATVIESSNETNGIGMGSSAGTSLREVINFSPAQGHLQVRDYEWIERDGGTVRMTSKGKAETDSFIDLAWGRME